mmetsp:Transcript_7388/g.11030  ORF Transcript_7388/g.11030 Transcript_7388/m.11030 type:complete len:112 (+) Transcript_7388:90-425(+)
MIDAEDRSFVNVQILNKNKKIIDLCRTSLCTVAGFSTGVLGCTGYKGLIFFVLFHAAVSFFLLLKMGFDLSGYTASKKDGSLMGFFFEGLFGLALTFILFWTLSYALVYVY